MLTTPSVTTVRPSARVDLSITGTLSSAHVLSAGIARRTMVASGPGTKGAVLEEPLWPDASASPASWTPAGTPVTPPTRCGRP